MTNEQSKRKQLTELATGTVRELAEYLVQYDYEYGMYFCSDGSSFGIDEEEKAVEYEMKWLKKEKEF